MSSTTRRDFLKQSAVASAGTILVGFQLPVFAKKEALVTDAFIRLELDGAVTLMMNHAEFGNGAYTSLSMMVAEELDLDWQTIKLEAAPTEQRYYSPLFGEYLTAGSVSTASSFMPMREAGARTRQLLLEAASIHFNAPINSLRTANSKVHHQDGRSVSYADLISVVEANGLKPPEKAKLKNPNEFAVLGKPQRRIEAPDKVDGSAIFGSDIRFDDMLFASVVRPPVYGGFARDFDGTAAKAIKGVVRVKKIDAGIAVLARDYWTAKKAAGLVKVNWEDGGNGRLSTTGYSIEYRKLSDKPGLLAENIGKAEQIIAETEDGLVIESVYEMPYLAHATMEPMNCTAKLAGDHCEIWVGTQYQSNDRTVVAKMLGVPEENVVINRTLSGGTFGRRASKTADFVTDAVQAASGENVPVQVIWSREEDIRGGHYRPQFIHRLKGVLDKEGYPLAWHQRVVGKSIMQNTKHDPAYMVRGMDIYSLDGCLQEPFGVFPYGTSYQIPNHRIESHNPPKTGVRPHEWRAVGHTHTGIAYECFLDELADKGNKDPLDLRLHLSRNHTRMHDLLQKLKKVSNWEKRLEAGRGRGMAARVYSNSWITQSVELTVDEDGSYSVDKVFCVVDCGFAVNPLGIQGQIEGGIMLGLNAVAYGAIDVVDGRVVQSNFHDYRPLRIHQMPEVEVHIIPSEHPPTGVGEQSTTPIAPAIVNAIFNATGKRVRDFPLDRQGFVLKGSLQMRESELLNHSGLLISACLGVICSSIVLPFYSIGVFVIPITTEFGWTRAEFQLAILFSTGTGIMTAPVVGMLIEKFGARIVALCGLVGLSAAFLFAATTSNLWQLYAAYTLMALLGAGTIPVTWTAAVTAQFETQRGFALGLVLSGTGLCAVLIPPAVAFITETWGWRMAYIFLACLPVFVSGPVVLRWFWPPGEAKSKEHAAAPEKGLSLAEAMRGYRFWVLLVSIFLVYIAMSGMVPNLIPALTDAGIPVADAARAISVFGIAVIAGRLIVGYLVDSLWAPGVAFVAICLPVAGSLLLVDITSVHLAMFAAFLLGLAAGAELDLMSFLAAKYFGLLHYPRIYAWMYAALALASGIAPMLFAWVFDQTASYDIGFMVGSGCFMIGAVMLLMLGRYPRWQA